jgi:ABC-type transport system substrate-binding protein
MELQYSRGRSIVTRTACAPVPQCGRSLSVRSANRIAHQSSPNIGRRSFLGRATAFGLGAGAQTLLPGASAWPAGETTKKRDLVVLQPSDITALDPHAAIHNSDIAVKFILFDTLVRRHPNGTLHAALATAWKRTTVTTWEVTLRRGVRWHDGTRFTSIDAKYSLDRTYDATVRAARLSPSFQTIDRTEAPDPGTLVIHTKQPDPLIPAKLAYRGQIVPWTYIDRVGFTVFNQRPVGTGPLRFVSWAPGDRCVLAANPDYWDGRLDVERVVLRPVPEPGARVEALLRGEADLITRLPPDHAERVATHPATRVVGALYAGLYVLLVNAWVPPLNDPLVRQALSLAIDREAIVREVWRGRGVVPSGPIPRGDDESGDRKRRFRRQPAAGRVHVGCDSTLYPRQGGVRIQHMPFSRRLHRTTVEGGCTFGSLMSPKC